MTPFARTNVAMFCASFRPDLSAPYCIASSHSAAICIRSLSKGSFGMCTSRLLITLTRFSPVLCGCFCCTDTLGLACETPFEECFALGLQPATSVMKSTNDDTVYIFLFIMAYHSTFLRFCQWYGSV